MANPSVAAVADPLLVCPALPPEDAKVSLGGVPRSEEASDVLTAALNWAAAAAAAAAAAMATLEALVQLEAGEDL